MITKNIQKGGERCITTLYNFTLQDSTEDYSNRKKNSMVTSSTFLKPTEIFVLILTFNT